MLNDADSIRRVRVERYGPGETVRLDSEITNSQLRSEASSVSQNSAAQPGDFILTHSSGVYGSLIRFGEWIRYRGDEKVYAHWSHAAIFVDDNGNIIEALDGGVQKRNIAVYLDTEYVVVHLPEQTQALDRAQAVRFAEYSLKDTYGWLTIVSIGLSLLTASKFGFGIDGQQICSALVARCLERIGEIFTETEPWHLMPADLAKHYNVQLTGQKGTVPPSHRGVIASSRPGRRRGPDLAT